MWAYCIYVCVSTREFLLVFKIQVRLLSENSHISKFFDGLTVFINVVKHLHLTSPGVEETLFVLRVNLHCL